MILLSKKYQELLNEISTQPPPFLTVGLARTCLAIGSLITFVFSGPHILFDDTEIDRLNFNGLYDNINIFYLFGFEHIRIYYIVCVIILIWVISGYSPRITGVLHWLVSFSLFRSALIVEGGDQITVVLTLLLIPITLSDTRRNHWLRYEQSKDSNYLPANISWTLIRIQMAFLYLQSGVEKVYKLEDWKSGTALYYFFNDPVYGSADWINTPLNSLFLNGFISFFLCWGIIVFEIVLFGAFFMRKRKRRKLLVLAIIFHASIAVFLGLVSFFFAMAGGLILYLSSSKFDRSILHKINYIKISAVQGWRILRASIPSLIKASIPRRK